MTFWAVFQHRPLLDLFGCKDSHKSWKIKKKREKEEEREGAGRKKTTCKTYGFNAPGEVVAILESVPNKTEYIIRAIIERFEREKGRN